MIVDTVHIGKVFDPYYYSASASKVREFLLAIGETNPEYSREDAVLPPTFANVITFWGGPGLEADLTSIGVEITNVLHAEQEYVYLAPMHTGDTFTATRRITDIYVRGTGEGEMGFVKFETDYVNQHNDAVLTEYSLMVVRGQGAE